MNDNILIVSDRKRNIAYDDFMAFYSFSLVTETPSELNDFSAAIIDIEDKEHILTISNRLRAIKAELPLLILIDLTFPDSENLVKEIEGFGISKLYIWKDENPVPFLGMLQSICHPEYPGKVPEIAIILPVYNEESRINNVIDFSLKLQELIEKSYLNSHIFFINDGSSDNTSGLVDKIIESEKNKMEYIHNTAFFSTHSLFMNTRKAGTYMTALKSIQADIYIFADADNSFTIEDISRMINMISDGYFDMVVGTKDLTAENRPLIRRIMSFFKRMLTKSLLPLNVFDSQTGLKAMNSVAARSIFKHLHEETGLAIDLEILYLARLYRLRVKQLPVICIDREGSHVNIIKDSIHFIKSLILIPLWNRKVRSPK